MHEGRCRALTLMRACGLTEAPRLWYSWALTCHCSQTGLQFNLRCTSNCSHGAKPVLLTREATHENMSLLLRGKWNTTSSLATWLESAEWLFLIRCRNSGVGIVRFAVHQRGAGHSVTFLRSHTVSHLIVREILGLDAFRW